MDLCGPSRQEGIGKENYFMLIIDDYSKLTWVSFLKENAEAFEKFKIFKDLTETQTCKRLKVDIRPWRRVYVKRLQGILR
jgi:hypothetical protein